MSETNVMTDDQFAALSDDAKTVGALFGMMRPNGDGGLTFRMQASRPSPRTQAALDELLAAGLIETADVYRPPAVTYRPLVETDAFLRWRWTRADFGSADWPLTDQITPPSPIPATAA